MKIDILFGILLTLNNKEIVTAKYLAQKYEISTRSIYRYISVLDSQNIPIITKSGRNGGIQLMNKIKLNSIFLTTPEKITLLNLTHHITNLKMRDSIQTKLFSIT